MISDFSCPACARSAWQPLGKLNYRLHDATNAYQALRLRILFEVWKVQGTTFSAHFQVCTECGFVCFAPRPSREEVDAKYCALSAWESPLAKASKPTDLDRKRSVDIFDFLKRYIRPGKVLDFGGGNGALLTVFEERGFDCSVVDHVRTTVPGVKRWGNVLEDIAPGTRFDVILACHVLEHVAQPHDVLTQLRQRLAPNGVLFIEVPLEILGGLPDMKEPVTHLNFFCEASLRALLRRAGFSLQKSRTMACRFQSGAYRYGVRAVAQASNIDSSVTEGADEAMQLLDCGPVGIFGKALRNPKMLAARFNNRRVSSLSWRQS